MCASVTFASGVLILKKPKVAKGAFVQSVTPSIELRSPKGTNNGKMLVNSVGKRLT
jgi:hypothetical protein